MIRIERSHPDHCGYHLPLEGVVLQPAGPEELIKRSDVPFVVRFSGYICVVGLEDGDPRIMLMERGEAHRVVAACTSYEAADAAGRLLNGWCETGPNIGGAR